MFPTDWYWRAEDGRVFSSARVAVVDEDDESYLDFVASNHATGWPRDEEGVQSDAALQEVLTPHGIYLLLDDLKSQLKAQIDAQAEVERGRYITPGAGQAMTYQQKATEAFALEGDASPDPANYRLLSAEVGITAPTLAEVGEAVRLAHNSWLMIGAAIEGVRLGAKKAVEDASTAEAARAAAQVDWNV